MSIVVEDAGAGLRKSVPPGDEVRVSNLPAPPLRGVMRLQAKARRMVDAAAALSASSFFVSAVLNESGYHYCLSCALSVHIPQLRRIHLARYHSFANMRSNRRVCIRTPAAPRRRAVTPQVAGPRIRAKRCRSISVNPLHSSYRIDTFIQEISFFGACCRPQPPMTTAGVPQPKHPRLCSAMLWRLSSSPRSCL